MMLQLHMSVGDGIGGFVGNQTFQPTEFLAVSRQKRGPHRE
jgi:hypothetical protein